MKRRGSQCAGLLGAVFLATGASGQVTPRDTPDAPRAFVWLPAPGLGFSDAGMKDLDPGIALSDLSDRAAAALGVLRCRVVIPQIRAGPGGGVSADLPLPGTPLALDLRPHSVRSPGYKLLVQGSDGQVRAAAPGPVRTCRGTVRGVPGSTVAASLLDDGVRAEILLPGVRSWVEPLGDRVPGAPAGAHAVYSQDDVVAPGVRCATGNAGDVAAPPAPQEPGGPPAGACESGIYVAELACDADYEYFLAYGSVEGVEERINDIVNAVNVQYERDVGIRHELTAIVVRTAEPDPYPDSLVLDDFQLEWTTNQAGIPRDVAHLFTGKNGGPGFAWLAGICEFTEHYAVSYSDCCGGFACATDITAHELGHVWGANHCSCSDPPSTMNFGLTCANWFHPGYTVPEILAYRDGLACLDCAPDPCPADVNDDEAVGIVDLIILLGNWGPNPGHPADIDGDGSVGVIDFLELLEGWGPCS